MIINWRGRKKRGGEERALPLGIGSEGLFCRKGNRRGGSLGLWNVGDFRG
jgi:hypothetical protein